MTNPAIFPPILPAACFPGDLKCMAEEGAAAAFTAIVTTIGKGVIVLTKFLSTFWLGVPSPAVASGAGDAWMLDPRIAQLQSWIAPGTAVIALCSFMVALLRLGWSGDLREGQGILRQLVAVTGGSLLVGAGAQLLIRAGDEFSPWVIEQASQGDASAGMNTLISSGLNSGVPGNEAGLFFIIFILCALGALMQALFMIVRGPVLFLLMVFVPPTAAAASSEEGWARFKRLYMLVLAFCLYKPVAALIYAAGLLLMTQSGAGSGGADVQGAIYGLSIMILAAVALPALIKFLVPAAAAGSSPAFSGAAGVGVLAGGAMLAAGAGAGALGAGAASAGAGAPGATAGGGAAASGPAGAGAVAPSGGGAPSGAGGGGVATATPAGGPPPSGASSGAPPAAQPGAGVGGVWSMASQAATQVQGAEPEPVQA